MVTRVHRWLGGFDADVTGAVQVHSSENRISIGAAAVPTANLHVFGTGTITGDTSIGGTLSLTTTPLAVASGGIGAATLTNGGLLLGSGTSAVTAMAVLTDGQMIVGDGSTDPVAESGATLRTSIGVGTGDSPAFTGLTTTGNVGIGVAAPLEILSITDSGNTPTIYIDGNSTQGVIRSRANRTGVDQALGEIVGRWNDTDVAKMAFTSGSDTTNKDDGNIVFSTAPSGTMAERMRIDSSGNVGIGESAPANLLHVKASDTGIAPHASAQIVLEREGTNYLQFLTAETGTSGILFGDGSDVDVGKIVYDHNATSMQFQVETGLAMSIDSSGATVTGRVSDTGTTANVIVPAGMIMPSGNLSTVVLGGWLLCDGTAVSRTDYSDLYTNVGTTFGAGNGNNTFNIPDFRDRFPLGKGTNNSTLGAQTGSVSASSALVTGTGTTGGATSGTGTTGSTGGSTASSATGTGTTGTGTSGTGTSGSTGGSTIASATVASTTAGGTTGGGTTGGGTTGTGTSGTGTSGSTSVSAHSVTTTTVAASAKDSSTTSVVSAVATHAAHTHSVPGLSVPGLSVPGLSVPGLSVPGLTIPALTVPSIAINLHTHSVPGLSVPGLSVPALTIPSLSVNGHTHSIPGLSIPGLSVPALALTVPSVVVQFLIRM